MSILEKIKKLRIDIFRGGYADDWLEVSKYLKKQGLYDWASDFIDLKNSESWLELGFGSGSLLESVISKTLKDHSSEKLIVGIDNNPECLIFAKENLERNQIPVTINKNAELKIIESTLLAVTKDSSSYSFRPNSVNLILEDILDPKSVYTLIDTYGKFDLITLSLPGAPNFDKKYSGLYLDIFNQLGLSKDYPKIDNAFKRHIGLQRAVYENAKKLLSDNGRLILIDRVIMTITEDKIDELVSYTNDGSFNVTRTSNYQYKNNPNLHISIVDGNGKVLTTQNVVAIELKKT